MIWKAVGRKSSLIARGPIASRSLSTSLSDWATIDPGSLGTTNDVYAVPNLVDGNWTNAKSAMEIIHPLDKDAPPIFTISDTQPDELAPFLASLRKIPKSGVHNPLKNPERYLQFGEISRKVRRLCYLGSTLQVPEPHGSPNSSVLFRRVMHSCSPRLRTFLPKQS